MTPLEIAMLDLEKAIGYTAWVMRHQRMTPSEAAIYHNHLAVLSRMKGKSNGGQDRTRV